MKTFPRTRPFLASAVLLAALPAFAQQRPQPDPEDRAPQTVDSAQARPQSQGEAPAFIDARDLFGTDGGTKDQPATSAATDANEAAAPAAAKSGPPTLGDYTLPATAPTEAAVPSPQPGRTQPVATKPAPAPALEPADFPTRRPAPAPAVSEKSEKSMDPPIRAGRIAVLEGPAAFQPAGLHDFTRAERNLPVTTGDRIVSGASSRTAIDAGTVSLRLGPATDVSVIALGDHTSHFGLGSGTLHLRTFELEDAAGLQLSTPNALVTVTEPGDLRVTVANGATTLTAISGAAEITGPESFHQTLSAGQTARLETPAGGQFTAGTADAPAPDALDAFSARLDRQAEAAEQSQSELVDDRTVGVADLATAGSWAADSSYGSVWFPRNVPAGWQPFSSGHWAFVGAWGWTWIAAEPWNFAPSHYGRWVQLNGRWGWVPGPRGIGPVYTPATVAFLGGSSFAAQIGYRGGVAGWFPLAPGEPWQPSFTSSALYYNRANAANLATHDLRTARSTYNQRRLATAYSNTPATYANHDSAVVLPEAAFAAGRPAIENAVELKPNDLANAEILPRLAIAPTHELSTTGPPAAPFERPQLFVETPTASRIAPHDETATSAAPEAPSADETAAADPAPAIPPAPVERREPQQAQRIQLPAPQRSVGETPEPASQPIAETQPAQQELPSQAAPQQQQQFPPDREFQPQP